MFHTQWPWLWFIDNLTTGVAYLIIAAIVWRERRVRIEYWNLFALFVSACGAHHIVHALPVVIGKGAMYSPVWLDSIQMLADVSMTSISVVAAIVLLREHWQRAVECQK